MPVKRGYAAAELILMMALVSILLVPLLRLMQTSARQFHQGVQQRETARVAERLSYELQESILTKPELSLAVPPGFEAQVVFSPTAWPQLYWAQVSLIRPNAPSPYRFKQLKRVFQSAQGAP